MLISSGDANRPFKVLGLVVGYASRTRSLRGKLNPESVYEEALERLTESADEHNADGLLFVNFQSRVASDQGCSGPLQAFEVFAWGTAVRWVKTSE